MTLTATNPFIVYCDDDEDDLFLVRESLQEVDPNLFLQTFDYGPEALRFLLDQQGKQIKPSLIVLDINMHPLSGKELLIRLRANPFYDDVPIVLFTTSSMNHDYEFALHYNASFITKPMQFNQMNRVAESFLQLVRERQDR